jgi:hypothetical protein
VLWLCGDRTSVGDLRLLLLVLVVGFSASVLLKGFSQSKRGGSTVNKMKLLREYNSQSLILRALFVV